MKNKLKEQKKLDTFLKDFLIKKEAKMQELSPQKRYDYDLIEATLKNRIKLHKEGKQEYKGIIEIINEYIINNF